MAKQAAVKFMVVELSLTQQVFLFPRRETIGYRTRERLCELRM